MKYSLCRSVVWTIFCILTVATAQNQTFKQWYESPIDGQVNSITVAGNTAYLGGTFTQCGFSTGYGVAVDTATADADHYFPKFFNVPGGQVMTAVPDSQGGWYIGGSFTTVNGQPRKYLAHVRSDKSVDPWDPAPNMWVRSIYYSGNKLYVGGLFDTIAGQPRGHGAAFDTSGNLRPWNPKADNSISAIQPVLGKVFLGGSFNGLGGQSFHMLLGAVDSSLGALTGWNPMNGGPSGSFNINKFIYANHQIYMCGSFSTLNSVNRIVLAKMDESGNINTQWNPGATIVGNYVSDISLIGDKLFVCGDFTSLGGQTRKNIVALDTATGLASAWNPASTNGAVRAIVANGSKLFIGGNFTSIGAKSISYLGALDLATGTALNWNPALNNVVFNLAAWGSTVYAGGYLTASGLITRNKLAAVDLVTGRIKPWNPNADGAVYALTYAKGRIYAGGSFTNIANGTRPGLTALDTLNGAYVAGSIASSPGGTVLALSALGNRLYAAGNYGLIAYNIPSGKLLSFKPNFNYSVVQSLCSSGSILYAGGTFSTVNGISRSMAVAFDTTTDQPTSWNPSLSSTCYSIFVNGSNVYLGGSFSTVGGISMPSVALVDAFSGNLVNGFTSSFSPVGFKVSTVALAGKQLYVGGQFNPIGTIKGTDYIATLDPLTGTVSSWRSGMVASEVASIVPLPYSQTVLVGGSFVTTSNWPQYNFSGYGDTSIHPPGKPILMIDPNPLNFGEVQIGMFKEKTITLQNTGTDTLHIKSVVTKDSVFASRLSVLTIAPNQTATDTIRFTPVVPGMIGSMLFVTSDAPSSPDTVFMGGFAYQKKFVQLVFSKDLIFFGGVHTNAHKDSVISVKNIGNDTADVTVTSADSIFSPLPKTFLLAPDSTIALTLRFAPNHTGEFSGRFFVVNSRTTPSSDTLRVTGLGLFTSGVADEKMVPKEFSLSQNYPNPFNPSTVVRYQISVTSFVTIKVYDVLGKEVALLADQLQTPGTYSVSFDAHGLSSGLYYCRMLAGGTSFTKKMSLVR
ncbi:MAG: T9SS type A sorting domain-containing protein [Bacteroidota bacterium]